MARIPSNLTNHLLIALPTLDDPEFAGSVALICRHDEDGAMGVIVNRPSGHTLGEVLMQMQLHSSDEMVNRQQVLSGGPVHPERGFVLHDGDDEWQSSLEVGNGLRLTTSRDVLAAMAAGNGPRNALLMLGCAGWDAGQLERELGEDAWLTAPADAPLLFEVPREQRWIAAGNRIGVDMIHLAGYSGHA